MNSQAIDEIRRKANQQLDNKSKSELGQFMTASVIAEFMAKQLTPKPKAKILDCGAGVGSLSIAAANFLKDVDFIEAWELDKLLYKYLCENYKSSNYKFYCHNEDFINKAVLSILEKNNNKFTHAVINPPYKKINSNSKERLAIRQLGIETVNLYSAFTSITLMMLEDEGEVVAIIPRSFCNGPYYLPFREQILKDFSIDFIHIFESRKEAFKEDKVLQENIIIKLRKGKQKEFVTISKSTDHLFNDLSSKNVIFEEIVYKDDLDKFIRIPLNDEANLKFANKTIKENGLNVSTGQIVDFRMKEFLQFEMNEKSIPLIYPHHFVRNQFTHPQNHKKPNALSIDESIIKWLMPNNGYYVLVKRFSSKEEKRRVQAYITQPNEIKNKYLAIENHFNVFHKNKNGLDKDLAFGLAMYLNSTYFDEKFRVFSGHTQVNATDLKNMKFPDEVNLKKLGKFYSIKMEQEEIDKLMEKFNEQN